MRAFGNLLIVIGLVVGLALSAFLFQWDSVQRAAAVTPTPSTTTSEAPPKGPASGGTSPTAAGQTGQGAIQSGKDVYNRFCNGCHPGGKAGVGPAIIGLGDEALRTVIRQGKGSMPAFGEAQISEAQVAELLAYTNSLK